MNTETEVKFLSVDVDEVRSKLKGAGAKVELSMREMKRAIIDYSDERLQQDDSYIRVRDEGNKVTLTFKKFESLDFGGAKEIETEVANFDETVKIFERAGLEVRSYQESKRETWSLDDIEIVIDEWPWLNPYVEIEGEDKDKIMEVAKALGFDWGEAVFGDVMAAYRIQYPHLPKDKYISMVKNVRFSDPLPDMFKP